MDDHELKQRTKDRNKAIWEKIISFEHMGIKDIFADQRSTLDALNQKSINTPITIVDDTFRIKEDQLNRTIQFKYDQIENERTIADEKAVTQRTIMALTQETNDYVLLVEDFITKVREVIMEAKITAQKIVAVKELEYQATRVEVAEKRAEARLKELDIKILLEEINRKYVEIEVLRAELDVAKANIRVAMALIAEKEAELREIQVRVEKAMAEVTRAELTAQIALTAADILIRKLAEVRYRISENELNQAFERIANKLAAILELIAVRKEQQETKTQTEIDLLAEVAKHLAALKDEQTARKEDMEANERVQDHEKTQTGIYLGKEEIERNKTKDEQIQTMQASSDADMALDDARRAAQKLINEAFEWACRNEYRERYNVSTSIRHTIEG